MFQYDSLGRRIEKRSDARTVRFVWDANTPLHEWEEKEERILPIGNKSLVTWLFDDGFIPVAKITNEGNYSIVSDYLGTPVEAYDADGKKVWSAELDSYGRVHMCTGEEDFIPFRYQGQYADCETGLYYNRFRYYSSVDGVYTQPDPIGLVGGNPTLYGYVKDTNSWVDVLGLNPLRGAPFPVNLLGNGCEDLARAVQKEIGGQFLQITNIMGPDSILLGPVHYSRGTLDEWYHHVAVIKDGTVFDGMTGPNGMSLEEYKKMFEYNDILDFKETKTITCK